MAELLRDIQDMPNLYRNLPTPNPRRKLTNEERRSIFEVLLMQSENGKLKRGSITQVAAVFLVCTRTVTRIWKRGSETIQDLSKVDVSRKFSRRVYPNHVGIELSDMLKVDLRHRTNLRSLAVALRLSTTTLYRRLKKGEIISHSNPIKPQITTQNKEARLRFCLSMLEPSSLQVNPTFKDMFDTVHIDEKWFFLTRTSERYYLHPLESKPYRTCKSKRFIVKVMFLAAVARPRFDHDGNEVFSGKIGIFPFTFQKGAQRRSRNRAAGTLETKPIFPVTKDVIRSCLINKFLPTIREKWPRCSPVSTIYIQQDNAKPHIDPFDPEFVDAAKSEGFDIQLKFQPPNSPDLNVLDLGFFRSIQSLQYQEAPKNIDELVLAVEKSFYEMPSTSLNKIFLSLQACMIEVIKNYGGNHYKEPHLGKNQMIREGNLPSQLQCELRLVEASLQLLQP